MSIFFSCQPFHSTDSSACESSPLSLSKSITYQPPDSSAEQAILVVGRSCNIRTMTASPAPPQRSRSPLPPPPPARPRAAAAITVGGPRVASRQATTEGPRFEQPHLPTVHPPLPSLAPSQTVACADARTRHINKREGTGRKCRGPRAPAAGTLAVRTSARRSPRAAETSARRRPKADRNFSPQEARGRPER